MPTADSDGEGDKHKVPLDSLADVELGGMPTIGPDGAPAIGTLGMAPAVPAATPDLFICLRGPCRHYWQLETFFASGNPLMTWDVEHGLKDPETGEPVRMPRQISRSCLAHPGTETEITDDLVFDCSRWDPLTPRENKMLAKRRSKYLKLHPDHDPRRR